MMRLSGNFIWVLLLFMRVAFADITIEIKSMDKRPLQQACIGTPFTIDVIIENCENPSRPHLNVPAGCKCQQTGVQTFASMSGSYATNKRIHSYVARIDEPGSYKIGPASVKLGNNLEIESDTIDLEVADTMMIQEQQATSSKTRKHKKHAQKNMQDPVYVTAELDKQTLVEGESCRLLLTFYSSDSSVNLERIHEVDYESLGLVPDEKSLTKNGTKNVDGTVYSYVQLQRELKTTRPGSYVIPSCKVDYSVRSGHTDFFSLVLGKRVVKTVYSNGVSLQVDPLPMDPKSMDFLGTCSSITATLDRHSIVQSEAATIRIEIEGDLEWNRDGFNVTQAPSCVKLFPSQQLCKQTKTGKKYTFEYVMQASGKPDEYIFPAQTIMGFDTKLRKVIQLSTHDIPFSILEPTPHINTMQSNDRASSSEPSKMEPDSLPIIIDSWAPYTQRVIGWWLFIWLIVLPMAALSLMKGWRLLYPHIWMWGPLRKRYARWWMQKNITQAQATNDTSQLYTMFMTYLSLLEPNMGGTYEQTCIWVESVCGDQLYAQWIVFMQTLQERRFSQRPVVVISKQEIQLYEQAQYWCTVLWNATTQKNKRYAMIVIPLIMTLGSLHANDQEHFLQGNKLYASGSYAQAGEAYEKIKRKGYTAYFNMGNCLYHQKEYARAIYYWKKAASCCPAHRSADCHKHLAMAYDALNMQEDVPISSLTISTLMLQLIFLLFWYILLACWWKYRLTGIMAISLSVPLLVIACALYARYDHEQAIEGVIIRSTQRYAGPSERYRSIGQIESARTVQICGVEHQWLKVDHQGNKGWIRADDVLVI